MGRQAARADAAVISAIASETTHALRQGLLKISQTGTLMPVLAQTRGARRRKSVFDKKAKEAVPLLR